ncbi:TOBE domain-containing protein [Nocardioides jejuensis]|uniref:Helix-turn-helix domain-containing protein n=1 Tax=Nocardioides jejuensis TaxID=2502782 RepID=A0A4V2NZR7_9ACTN|nr:TOBE domain-containing protein [Nocardioides jejuensis]TCJ29912.1 helix-turn-helix domain-containing protein [Nocardioides jejuensis]
MPHLRIKDAAAHLGVSDDTVRRWVDRGLLEARVDDAGRKVVDGYEVAMVARDHAQQPGVPGMSSARNRFVGLVTDITLDTVMAQVELQCGPFRVVSLMSSEAVRDLGLERGSLAVASIKSTNVVIEAHEGMA